MASPIGTKARVREYLAERDGRATDVAAALGITIQQASQALNDLKTMGGAYRVDKHGSHPVYSAKSPERKSDKPTTYKPRFEALTHDNYDLYAGRDLALLAR